MSEHKKFFVWFVDEGEGGGKEVELYEPDSAAEAFVGQRMDAGWIPQEEGVEVDVRDPDGTVHHFDVEIEVSITAGRRSGLYGPGTPATHAPEQEA